MGNQSQGTSGHAHLTSAELSGYLTITLLCQCHKSADLVYFFQVFLDSSAEIICACRLDCGRKREAIQ